MPKTEIEELAAVEAAEENVKTEEAKKLAKREEAKAKRANWKGPFKYVGRLINVVVDHPVATGVSVIAGIPIGVGGALLYNHFIKSDKTADEEISDEAVEAPFDE